MLQINWKLKALLYKLFGIFKLKNFFYFTQKYITKRSKVEITEISKFWIYHADSIEKNSCKNVLEVGAGKSLEQNIFFSYKFDNLIRQTVIDINEMIDFELVNQASEQISNILKIKNKGEIKNLKQLKNLYEIDYKAPFQLKELKDGKDLFDICISTAVIEHFSITDLKEYLYDLKNILTKEGLVSSNIDYSDHYSHTDKNISGLNYLSYSEKEWKKYNNLYLFQNRLRHQDYKKIFKYSGYKIKNILLGNSLKPPSKISNDFDVYNEETFISCAYFLIGINNS